MSSAIGERLLQVRESIPARVQLVAVSKFHPADAVLEAYNAGQRLFGESRVQELVNKQSQLPQDISWHFIGHLQTNKVRQLIGRVALIESVDSERLLRLIDEESLRKNLTTRVLLQVHVAGEETKFGFDPEELRDFFINRKFLSLKAVEICGLMAMATNTDDNERIRTDFEKAADLFREIKATYGHYLPNFATLSMGMSDDRNIAIECGSTMVRVGTAIFGSRGY